MTFMIMSRGGFVQGPVGAIDPTEVFNFKILPHKIYNIFLKVPTTDCLFLSHIKYLLPMLHCFTLPFLLNFISNPVIGRHESKRKNYDETESADQEIFVEIFIHISKIITLN